MTPLISTNLKAADWIDGTLYIEFNNGGVYSYAQVPKTVFQDLIIAESAGKYFTANIRNKYETTRVS